MNTDTIVIRDALFELIGTLNTDNRWKTLRKVPMPTLLRDELPAVSVFVLDEEAPSDGAPNLAFMKYVNDLTIGISIARGFEDTVYLDGGLDWDVALILNGALTNAQFTRRIQRAVGGLFESVPRYRRELKFSESGEAYMAEARLAVTFRYRQWFYPTIVDDLEQVHVTAKIGGDGTPPVYAEYDLLVTGGT